MLIYYIIILLLGLSIGSFINVVIYRLRHNGSLLGRSYCPHCKKQLKAVDLVPILSFLFLKGECRYCNQKISWEYLFVEAATTIIFLIVFYNFDLRLAVSGWQLATCLVFSIFLIIIFIYDFKYQLILDQITIPAIITSLILNLFLGKNILDLLYGAIIVSGFFAIQFFLSRGKWVGGGDIRLGALMGVILGLKMGLIALFIAYIIGGAVSIFLVLDKKKRWNSRVPMGTFLTLATFVAMLWGEQILIWYMRFLTPRF